MTKLQELKTEEEVGQKLKYLLENPFSPNKFLYKEEEVILLGKKALIVKNYKESALVEDYYHPGYYILAGHNNPIHEIVEVRQRSKYNSDNSDTWAAIIINKKADPLRMKYTETADFAMYNLMSRKIITKRDGEAKVVQHTEEEMSKFGLVRGTINPDYWFYEAEKKDLDKMLPYKKFDHIVYKENVKQLQAELTNIGLPKEEVLTKVTKVLKDNIKFGVESLTYSAFEGMQYTFGVEIETCLGRLEKQDYDNLNVKAVHDGSLRDAAGNTPGGEYVTGVLIGDAGLTQLSELCRVLSSKCRINNLCGVHVHVGSLNWNKEDIVYSYILAELIEDELFQTLPKSRRSNSYCRRLTQITLRFLKRLSESTSKGTYDIAIDEIYNEIYKEVTLVKGKNIDVSLRSDNKEDQESFITGRNFNRQQQHPLGAKCGYDKNAQRYCWLNFVTLLYSTKGSRGSNTLNFGA